MRFAANAISFFLFTFTLLGQELQQPLYLEVTFPQHSDTINADKIRLSGYTDPGARLTINKQQIQLFPQGSFVSRVALQERMNQIIVVARKGDETVQDILFIYRTPVLKTFAEKPTRIDNLLAEPEEDIWLQQHDYLTVSFKASPGGAAKFSVAKIGKNFPMIEKTPAETAGVRGIYEGVIKVNDAPENQPLDITFEIQGLDGKKKRRKAPGHLYILPQNIPLIGKTLVDTWIQASSKRYLPITRLPDSVAVHIIGRANGRYKIDLENRTGWIDIKDVKLAPWGTPLPRTTIGAPQIDYTPEWLHLTMQINRPMPFFIKQSEHPLKLELQVIGAQQASHWITYPNGVVDIKNLSMNQTGGHIFQLTLELEQEYNWGYRCYYQDGALHFLIRRPPFINPDNPLDGLKIAIDPGHGGDEIGAISPLGVKEKDINKQWADTLAELLRAGSAQVIKTRQGDETVSLPQRIKTAEAADALLFISLHNNGVTPFGNALGASGTSTYFTLPQNRDLAWAIYPHMVELGLQPYGRIYNSYFVTNSTSFLTTLVEGGFLTNPHEEQKLSDPDFIRQMARAVYNGIVDFIESRIE